MHQNQNAQTADPNYEISMNTNENRFNSRNGGD
jgi:hypothetical protein